LQHNLPKLEIKPIMSRLSPLMTDGRIAKVAHNGKQIINRLKEHGMELNNLGFDTMIAGHLLGVKSLSLQSLSLSKLGAEMQMAMEGKALKLNLIEYEDVEASARNACAAVVTTRRLYDVLRPELEREELLSLFREVEMPLIPVLARMERNGVALDTALFSTMSQSLGEKLVMLEDQIYSFAGRRFNINSPQQMGAVLFGELKIRGAKRTKSGYSTEAAVLEELKGEFPIVKLILDYRQLAKLKSTYIDALPELVNPVTGRLHTTFNQTVTATGRLSSTEPNLQNIPIRGEMGRQVRQAFVAAKNWVLVSGDYSQIDLRVLAHLSQEPRLLEAFRQDQDIHTATAAEVFGVRVEDVIRTCGEWQRW
jgi:DNA polymerase I